MLLASDTVVNQFLLDNDRGPLGNGLHDVVAKACGKPTQPASTEITQNKTIKAIQMYFHSAANPLFLSMHKLWVIEPPGNA